MNFVNSNATAQQSSVQLHNTAPPVKVPSGYTGPAWLPGTGRMVWWTGRVAIGLRHQAQRHVEATVHSNGWVQKLILS